jgi:hypothetical protein
MRALFAALVAALVTVSVPASAQTCAKEQTCVDDADLAIMLKVLRERKCLLETTPVITADPITIVVDRQGRVYGSGSDPKPYTLHVGWCDFAVTAQSQMKTVVAEHVDASWGFRFRPKATFGILGTELLVGERFTNALDGGILLEPFYVRSVNVNGYVGVRSVGAGIGFDLTKNFGLNVGYAITWSAWRSNPFASLYFAFW